MLFVAYKNIESLDFTFFHFHITILSFLVGHKSLLDIKNVVEGVTVSISEYRTSDLYKTPLPSNLIDKKKAIKKKREIHAEIKYLLAVRRFNIKVLKRLKNLGYV